ncbi:ComF family protein [Bacillus sp. 1P06AnD]|uniref:ComF family protein n=1 Tax=Bacillus sp. 1P06AnD TaxID=3132208 RepID=UPI0039A14D87
MFKKLICLYCGAVFEAAYSWETLFVFDQPLLCQECYGKMERIEGACCRICSRVMPEQGETLCHDCERWEQDNRWKGTLSGNTSLYAYNDFMKELIALYKYRGDVALANLFADDLRKQLKKWKGALICPVPLSEERMQERGFNQSEELIKAAGHSPVLLLNRSHSEKQSKKSRRQRIELPQIFTCRHNSAITSKHIVLVDDIYTTGSTLRHAAELLIQAGASSVHSLTVAR